MFRIFYITESIYLNRIYRTEELAERELEKLLSSLAIVHYRYEFEIVEYKTPYPEDCDVIVYSGDLGI